MECCHVIGGVKIRNLDIDLVKERGRRRGGTQGGSHIPPHLRHHPSAFRRDITFSSAQSATGQSRMLNPASNWDLGNWNCVECGTTLSPWLCLYCGLIHCGRYVNQDGLRHFNQAQEHSVCMDCHNYAVFCYVCDDFVNTDTVDTKIDRIRESLQFFNSVRVSDHSYFSPRFLPSNRPNNALSHRPKRPLSAELEVVEVEVGFEDGGKEYEEEEEYDNEETEESTVYSSSCTSNSGDSNQFHSTSELSKLHRQPRPPPQPHSPTPTPTPLKRIRFHRDKTLTNGVDNQETEHGSGASSSSGGKSRRQPQSRMNGTTNGASSSTSSKGMKKSKSSPGLAQEVKGLTLGLRGLRNLGNTCFMNAVLQSLNNITDFSHPLITLPDSVIPPTNGHSSPPYRTRRCGGTEQIFLTEELQKTLKALQETDKSTAISPDALFSVIWKLVPRFRGFQQQDAHEFLRCVLDRLLVELRTMRPCGAGEEGGKQGWTPPKHSESLVSTLFQGILQSQVTCLTCDGSSHKQDPFLDLSLDIPLAEGGGGRGMGGREEVLLEECLGSFFDKEELDRTEQYMCSNCRKKRPSTKQFFVRRIPYVLCLHLKRFRWHQGRQKLDSYVRFPVQSMDIGKFLMRNPKTRGGGVVTQSSEFDLAAVVVHHGSSAGSGHYTAYALRGNAWYHFNDSCVRLSSESVVSQQKAYILFYVKKKP